MIVDQHFGHVQEFYVYEYQNGNTVFKEKRAVDQYCNGPRECEDKEDKMETILRTIEDCNAVITLRIGETPRQRLRLKGIRVFIDADRIEDSVRKAVEELLKADDKCISI